MVKKTKEVKVEPKKEEPKVEKVLNFQPLVDQADLNEIRAKINEIVSFLNK